MKFIVYAGLPLAVLAGCTSGNQPTSAEVLGHQSPADPHSGIRHQNHLNVTRGFNKRAVVDPSRWRDRNVEPAQEKEPTS